MSKISKRDLYFINNYTFDKFSKPRVNINDYPNGHFITLTYKETVELFLKGTIPIPNCNNIEDICNNKNAHVVIYKVNNLIFIAKLSILILYKKNKIETLFWYNLKNINPIIILY